MNRAEEYEKAWRSYRKMDGWLFIWGWGGFALLVWAIASKTPQYVLAPLGLLWLAGTSALSFRLQRFRCPRCDSLFRGWKRWQNECAVC